MVATPNGERSLAQIQAELQAAGYNGPWTNADMISAYTRTAAPPAPTNQAPQVFGATPPVAGGQGGDLAALTAAFNSAGGLSQQQIANQKAEFDAQLAQQREQMERIGLPQLAIQQRLADLQQQQFQFQMRQVMAQQGLAERQLGLQALQTQAQLGGPSNWVQAYNLAQGLRNTDIPVFMNRLLTGQQGPAAVGGAGLSAPQSLQTLAAQAGAGGGDMMAGGAPPSGFGGPAGSGVLAPMPFLSGGAGGGGGVPGVPGVPGGPQNFAETTTKTFGPAGGGYSGGGQRQITPTGNYEIGGSQDFGAGVGQGSRMLTGDRGQGFTGYDPTTGRLGFNLKFLENKPAVTAYLHDATTGEFIGHAATATDPHPGQNRMPGDSRYAGTGDADLPYLSGDNINSYFQLNSPLDPTHQYKLTWSLPNEGGGGEPLVRTGADLITASGGNPLQPASGWDFPAPGGYHVQNGHVYNAAGADTGVQAVAAEGASAPTIGALARGATATAGGTPNFNEQTGQPMMARAQRMGPTPTDNTPGFGGGGADFLRGGGTGAGYLGPATNMGTSPGAPAGPNIGGVYDIGRAIFTAGGGALGPQALEGIGQTGQQMLQSVGQATGADWNQFLNQYMRSRIGQGAAQAA